MRWLAAWAGVCLLFVPVAIQAASFDCATASTPQQKAICAAPKLSKLDEDVAAARQSLLNQLSPASQDEVRQDEQAWVGWITRICPPNSRTAIGTCLASAYTEHLNLLRRGAQRFGEMLLFSRLKVLTAPNTDATPADAPNVGLGVGRFSWPEIDRPGPAQAAFNRAMRKWAEPGRSVADNDVDVYYFPRALNDQLIEIEMSNSTYSYGAAHPNAESASFAWWLRQGRELRAQDVFRAGSKWQQFLGELAYRKLKTGKYAATLFDPQTVRLAAHAQVQATTNWTISRKAFEIRFPVYSVAPHSGGMPSVALTWPELKDYLAPGFEPDQLPIALPRPWPY